MSFRLAVFTLSASIAVAFCANPAFAVPSKSRRCEGLFSLAAKHHPKDTSVRTGVLGHGEHWVDLILAQSSREGDRSVTLFETFQKQLTDAIAKGRLTQTNEKIDGSPSLVFGWSQAGQPFVAYKSHFTSKTNQKLVLDSESALSVFPRSEALKLIFSNVFRLLRPAMGEAVDLHNYIFQADLLFSPSDDRKFLESDGVRIRANTLDYVIKKDHALFRTVAEANLAFAVHSVGKRTVAPDGRIGVLPLEKESDTRKLLERFVQATSSENVFASHPLQKDVALGRPMTVAQQKQIGLLNHHIRKSLGSIEASFRELSRLYFEAELRIYFNSQVRPPENGGVYRLIADGNAVDPEAVTDAFGIWLSKRKAQKPFEVFQSLHPDQKKRLVHSIDAYLSALRIQALILPHLLPALRSKIGGGPVEGLMLSHGGAIVKLVDRLTFTLMNNSQRIESPFGRALAPFDSWTPGQAFAVLKGQPVHAGHISMLKMAASKFGNLTVLASDKEPNLLATKLSEVGAANTVAAYKARDYTHVFSTSLRNRIFAAAWPKSDGFSIHQTSPTSFWKYVESAQRAGLPGKVRLIVGEKEIHENRYDAQLDRFGSHFSLEDIAPQNEGISATDIRDLVKTAALGSKDARTLLKSQYTFIGDEIEREAVVNQMISEWLQLDALVQGLLEAKLKKPRAS